MLNRRQQQAYNATIDIYPINESLQDDQGSPYAPRVSVTPSQRDVPCLRVTGRETTQEGPAGRVHTDVSGVWLLRMDESVVIRDGDFIQYTGPGADNGQWARVSGNPNNTPSLGRRTANVQVVNAIPALGPPEVR